MMPEESSPPAAPTATEQKSDGSGSRLDSVSKAFQVVSVVVGVVISVGSFNETRKKEADAREAEARAREFESKKYLDQRNDEAAKKQAEAAAPFLQLRQKLYLDAVQAAGVLANPEDHSAEEVKKARTRFRELYVAELSLVEGIGVEKGMVGLAKAVDPKLIPFDDKQRAAYRLAHSLRNSLVKSWNVNEAIIDNPDDPDDKP